MPFPQLLTTTPFARSSTGWFEVNSCKPTSGDLLPSSVKHRKLPLAFVTHVRQAASVGNAHCDPLLSPRAGCEMEAKCILVAVRFFYFLSFAKTEALPSADDGLYLSA